VPHFASPVSQKTFFKADKVQLKWNTQGSGLIVLAQTDVDKSNKSYYGETTMYLLSAAGGFDARITLDKEGPIHDVTWSPNGNEFGVIYGYMPAKTTIFNQRGVATHSFQLGPRNTITFSPNGRFVLVAGFGNLAGQIDVYDLKRDYAKVCTIEGGNPSVCQWSPDSRYIMTATTSPRLRVDNGIKLWHVGGGIMYSEDMVELYNAMWRPMPPDQVATRGDPLNPVPVPHASAVAYLGTIKTPSKPAGAYRPPGARGTMTPLHFKREDEGGAAHVMSNGASNAAPINGFGRQRWQVPGADPVDQGGVPGAAPAVPGADVPEGTEGLSKAALKNKKKRGNKKAKEAEAGTAAGNDAAPLLPPHRRELGHMSGNEGRSPERRGHFHSHSHSRSHSRNNLPSRNRSNTQRQRDEHSQARGQHPQHQFRPQGAPTGPAAASGPAFQQPAQLQGGGAPLADAQSPNTAQTPRDKKVRSLQKKIRAIEDLEMRFAGGEKLEDTQLKKIATKQAVLSELQGLGEEP
jgi:translation initiation factor 2A